MRPDASPPAPLDDDPVDSTADEAAALDDYLGGFSDDTVATPAPSGDPEDVAATLDLMLRLRQVAAADGVAQRLPTSDMPATIGRYRVVGLAGRGGFADVWEAIDPVLRRRVAVKTPQPGALLAPTLRRRFLREAEIASRLVHPRIVTIHEVGEAEGREFIVEELCPGGSLATWLDAHPGPLPPRVAAVVVQALAEAAAYAHDRGVIHRDIKPGNVLLTPAPTAADALLPDGLTVKLGDFGLSALHESSSDLTQLTVSGTRLGTPAWMAPEQIDRSFGSVGPATDVHGLGLLLCRLLTGQSPHDGRSEVEIYRSVLLDEPQPLDRTVRGMSRDLAAICATCLAKRPAERYASAAALATDLGRWLDGRPTVARPLSPAARALRGLARRRIVATLAAGLMAAIVGAAWIARAWLAEGRAATEQRDAIRHQTAAVELQRAFEAWRTGNVSRSVAAAATVRSLDPPLADSVAGRWLEQRLHGERRMLFAPAAGAAAAAAHAVAVAPHGGLVAAGFADGSLRLIDDATRRVTHIADAHDEINDVCFAPDGRTVATVGQDGRCRWWHVTDGPTLTPTGTTVAANGPLYGVTFTAAGRRLAVGGEDRMVRVFDVASGAESQAIPLPLRPDDTGDIEAIAAVRDDVVAVACGRHVFLVDTTGGMPPRELEYDRTSKQSPTLHSLAVSPDGTRVAAGGSNRCTNIWSIPDGRLVSLGPDQPSWVHGCCYSADGTLLATGCRDGLIRVADARDDTPRPPLEGHDGRVWDVAFTPSGRLVSAGADGTIREWDPERGFELNGIEDVPVACEACKFVEALPDMTATGRQRLIAGGPTQPPFLLERDGPGQEWRRDEIACRIDKPAWLSDMAASPTGTRCAFGFEQGSFMVASLEGRAGDGCMTLPAFSPKHGAAAWTPQGMLVTAASEHAVTAWPDDVRQGQTVMDVDWPVRAVAVAPAGPPRVAIAGARLVIVALPASSATSGRQSRGAAPVEVPRSQPGDPTVHDMISDIAWSPDGRRVVCGTRGGTVDVFDGLTGARLGSLAPHAREVEAVAWSPDGRVIVTADSHIVRLSDARSLATFDEIRPGWLVLDVAVSPAGDFIAISGKTDAADQRFSGRLAVITLAREHAR